MSRPESVSKRTAGKDGVSVATAVRPEARKFGSSFAVDPVTPAGKPIWTESLADSLSWRFRREILVLPEGQQVINADHDILERLQERFRTVDIRHIGNRHHPLIDAVHTAFAQHRPLALSPDDIWLVIAQGFSHHVAANAEALRHRLVRHEGSRELNANCAD